MMGKHAPAPVTILQVDRGQTADKLLWYGAHDYSGGDYLLYNIYASPSWPVDTDDPRNLIATRHRGQSLRVPHGGRGLFYAITAIDRYGNESAPKSVRDRVPTTKPQIDFRQLIMRQSPKKH